MWCSRCKYGSESCRGSSRCPQCGQVAPWLGRRPFPAAPTGKGSGKEREKTRLARLLREKVARRMVA